MFREKPRAERAIMPTEEMGVILEEDRTGVTHCSKKPKCIDSVVVGY